MAVPHARSATPPAPWLALVQLSLGASLLASCAYMYLIRYRSSAIADSYAHVKPAAAPLSGMLVLDERISLQTMPAMAIILLALIRVFRAASTPPVAPPQRDLE